MILLNYLKPHQAYDYANKMILISFCFVLFYVIGANLLGLGIECQFKKLHTINCPSCGLTRGVFECFKFNFKKATALNRLSLFICIYITFQLIQRISIVLICKYWNSLFLKKLSLVVILDAIITLMPILILNN